MRITVAICTWNNSRLLRQTLKNLCELDVPEGLSWELVVVNNNSTDDSQEVIDSFEGALPLRPLFESNQGHCHARNCAVGAAQGEWIVWTDDDVLVNAEWLAAYASSMDEYEDADFFGGPVLPVFEGSASEWIRETCEQFPDAYASRDFGDEPILFDRKRIPFGANFAVRTSLLRQHPFDPKLGRVGKGLMGGDETTLLRQLLDEGNSGRWVPGARVQHIIKEDRQSLEYIRRFFYSLGIHEARYGPQSQLSLKPLRRLDWVMRAAAHEAKYLLRRALQAAPKTWAKDLKMASRFWGRALG